MNYERDMLEKSRTHCFCPVCLSVVNFNICLEPSQIETSHSPNDAISNDIKVNDLVIDVYVEQIGGGGFVATRKVVFHSTLKAYQFYV